MKILIITPRIPYPPYRGDKLKIFNISKILEKKNHVTILTFKRFDNQESEINALKKLGLNMEIIHLSIFESLFRASLAIFSKTPFQVAWYKSTLMKEKVRKVAPEFDVVYYHLIRSAQYLSKSDCNKPIQVLDITDAVSLYLTRLANAEKNILKKFFIKIEKKRISCYERIAEKFDTLFICSNVDKKFLENAGLKVNIELLSNGIDTEYFSAENDDYEKNRIIFTGNMPYYPNQDAAVYFAKEIFPLILRELPEAKFYIVGQKPPLRIKKLENDNIKVTGFVQDIKSEYLQSAVNIAPMRFGAGTLNKIIESIALGVPVVATSITVQGLPESLKKFILIADDPISFSGKVMDILRNHNESRQHMKEGQKIIKKLLSWDKIVSEFEQSLKLKLNKLNKLN